jgi:hypothetical protein
MAAKTTTYADADERTSSIQPGSQNMHRAPVHSPSTKSRNKMSAARSFASQHRNIRMPTPKPLGLVATNRRRRKRGEAVGIRFNTCMIDMHHLKNGIGTRAKGGPGMAGRSLELLGADHTRFDSSALSSTTSEFRLAPGRPHSRIAALERPKTTTEQAKDLPDHDRTSCAYSFIPLVDRAPPNCPPSSFHRFHPSTRPSRPFFQPFTADSLLHD